MNFRTAFLNAVVDRNRGPRRHVVGRIIEGFAPTWVACFTLIWTTSGFYWPLTVAVISTIIATFSTLLQYLLFEFVLEPLGGSRNPVFGTGHYWERPARDDDPGDRFRVG